ENSVPNAVNEITQNNISIYQNALNKNFLTIATTDNFTLNNAHIIITNLQGQTVYRNRIQNSKSIEINTASFAGGAIYIIAVKSSEFTYKQKIINK
ncbi:T9SS type A sorting domain-containing protein, partial [bacterium]|nr:T9SS type A sorting domain-containing protein [bacterium]